MSELNFSEFIEFRKINLDLFIIFADKYIIISKECKGSLFNGVRVNNNWQIRIGKNSYTLPLTIRRELDKSKDSVLRFITYIYKNIGV